MLVLVDSNILVFSADPNSPFFSEATRATALLLGRGEELCVFPQNLIEFWVVATRPVASRGLGFSAAQAQAEITRIKCTLASSDRDGLQSPGFAESATQRRSIHCCSFNAGLYFSPAQMTLREDRVYGRSRT